MQKFLFVCFTTLLISFHLYSQPFLAEPEIIKIAEGFNFTEGPVWVDGLGLLFSDIPENKVYLIDREALVSVYLAPSGNSNGLALDNDNNLLLAQHGERQLAVLDEDNNFVPIATSYNGDNLNSPNDIAVRSDGAIFFTDPPYGISTPQEELGFYGIYMVNSSGELNLLDQSLRRPNGIAFSPDESKLYVTDTEEKDVFVWDVEGDQIVNRELFVSINAAGDGTDGLKVDNKGYLYISGPSGIWIYGPDKTFVETVPVPGQTTNCAWGKSSSGDSVLFVTSGSSIYLLRNAEVEEPPVVLHVDEKKITPELYPNPFSDQIIVSMIETGKPLASIKAYAMNGKSVPLVWERNSGNLSDFITIDTSHMPEGVYFLILESGDGVVEAKKMVK